MSRIFACEECGELKVAARASSRYCCRKCLGRANGRRQTGIRRSTPAQFWDAASGQQDPKSCWEWMRARQRDGYGIVRHAGQCCLAHRVAWILTYETIPAGLEVLHRCNNRPCINPSHLYLGTQRENMRDRKQRGGFGLDEMPQARWRPEEVMVLRAAVHAGATLTSLARQYQTGTGGLSDMIHGRTYAYIPGAVPLRITRTPKS